MSLTTQKVAGYVQAAAAIAETIRDLSAASPLGGVPSGELYARVMGYMTLDVYQGIIERLKGAGLVAESGHLLRWVGPVAGEKLSEKPPARR